MKQRFFLAIWLIINTLLIQNRLIAQSLPTIENALLWKITGKGLPGPSYLYGTIHMICPEDFQISDTLKSVFNSSEKIYFEIDMDDPGMLMKTMKYSILDKGSLRDLLSEEDYTKLNHYISDSLHLPMLVMNKMKPFTLISLLYTKILPCSNPASYEQAFLKMAQTGKKEVLGLETLEDQFAVFDHIPDTAEARMLVEMINTMPEQRKEFAEMVNAYKRQDLGELYSQLSQSPDLAGFEDELLVTRNKNWIPVMNEAMKKQPVFFAIGAGHLAGTNGIVSLLRKEGYEVTPLK